MTLVSDSKTLVKNCEVLRESEFIAVDTEFMRDKTYWSQLCLVQLATPDLTIVIDALSPKLDIDPVLKIMANNTIIKVFHSARQDLEIFYKLMGTLPAPIFDTQIAAMACGFGESAGYDKLVKELINVEVDKTIRHTDWTSRPLSSKQIKYAEGDVTHLWKIYLKLKKKLEENKRESWLDQEINNLTKLDNYLFSPSAAWQRLKVKKSNPRFLAILKEIAAWRETEAQQQNVPRNRIIRDESIIEIAHRTPKSINQLVRIRGLDKTKVLAKYGEKLLKAIKIGNDIPTEELPTVQAKKLLPRDIGPATELLKVLLKMRSEEYGIAQKLISTTQELEKISAYGEKADVLALRGWRRHIFGEDALKLASGSLGITIEKKKLKVFGKIK
tara:strand:+ start:1508 stop:2665 length:1158 start_codon:yes stop_codon:yes gene_type:complete